MPMLENHYKYVLLGGGIASGSAAEAIRQRDTDGSILLVGQEVNRPYYRLRLHTDYLTRQSKRADIVVHSQTWFAENHIALSTGHRGAHLDTARQTITLDNGEEIAFDKLLIATGANARPLTIPGGNLPNVFTLRTIDDADRLHNAIEKAKAESLHHEPSDSTARSTGHGVAAILGGGLLGVELAATLTQLGLAVELIVGAPYPWKKYVGEYTGKLVTNYLARHGVRVHLDSRPQQLDGDGRVQRIALNDGRIIPCDFVVAAIGAIPNKDILRGTPITSEKAILADAHCQTNLPGIYAAGDCAAVFDPLFGKHRVIDHWQNAQLTGRIAGANMAGGETSYDSVNCFRTHVFDLQVVGWGESRQVDRRHIRGDVKLESPNFVEIGVAADGRIAQIIAVGHNDEDQTLESLVKQRASVDGKEESLKDPARPLSEFLA